MALDLDSTEETADAPAGDPGSPAPGQEGAPASTGTAEGQPATPPAAAAPPVPPKPEDRIIELSRSNREHVRRATSAEKERDTYKAQVEELAPVVELLGLAKTDPLRFIDELSDVVGLDPAVVLEARATRAAGGERQLTAEERVAILERHIRERDEAEQRAKDERTAAEQNAAREQALQDHHGLLAAVMKEKAADFPLCVAEEKDAIEAAWDVIVLDWLATTSNGTKPLPQEYEPPTYEQALAAVEQALREETERRAPKLGYQRAAAPNGARTPQSTVRGLSNELMAAAPLPDNDHIMTTEEIDALARQMFGGR